MVLKYEISILLLVKWYVLSRDPSSIDKKSWKPKYVRTVWIRIMNMYIYVQYMCNGNAQKERNTEHYLHHEKRNVMILTDHDLPQRRNEFYEAYFRYWQLNVFLRSDH